MVKLNQAQMDAAPNFFFSVSIGYNHISAGGLFRVYGGGALQHWRDGGIVLVRLALDGQEASWTHGLGINTALNAGDVWAEVECYGEPRSASSWRPTGKAWPVGHDVFGLKKDAGIVDCVVGVPRK